MLKVQPIQGIPAANFRGVACIDGSDAIIDHASFLQFIRQNKLVRQQIMSRMTGWVNRFPKGDRPKQYHGWNKKQLKGKYTECFVFKSRTDKFDIRIYGFKCHPSAENRRFELFVPVEVVDQKRQNETDKAILERVMKARNLRGVERCLDRWDESLIGGTK